MNNPKTNPEILCPSLIMCGLIATLFDQTVFCWARQEFTVNTEEGWVDEKKEIRTVLRLTQSVNPRDIVYPAPTCQEMQNYITSQLNSQKDGKTVFPENFDQYCGIRGYQWWTNPSELAQRVVMLQIKIMEWKGTIKWNL